MNFFWILCVYGVTFLLTDSDLLSGPRDALRKIPMFHKFFNCYFCVGFWVSLCLSFANNSTTTYPLNHPELYMNIFVSTFSGAAGAYLLDVLAVFLITSMESKISDD